jgi:hypothetical protein
MWNTGEIIQEQLLNNLLYLKFECFDEKWSLDQNSVDRNCVLSLDRNFVNHLTEFHLTESVDQNFKITQNDINKSFDQLTKKNWRILAVDRKF